MLAFAKAIASSASFRSTALSSFKVVGESVSFARLVILGSAKRFNDFRTLNPKIISLGDNSVAAFDELLEAFASSIQRAC